MRVLGAILAGGQSRRFGSDKAQATVGSERLIDIARRVLSSQCEETVICGREEPGLTCLRDRPASDMGPVGGLYAALEWACERGFDCVLTCGCDIPNLPADLLEKMGSDGPAIVDSQPVVGVWPVSLASECLAFIECGGRSLYRFADRVGAAPVSIDPPLLNVNHPGDLPDQ